MFKKSIVVGPYAGSCWLSHMFQPQRAGNNPSYYVITCTVRLIFILLASWLYILTCNVRHGGHLRLIKAGRLSECRDSAPHHSIMKSASNWWAASCVPNILVSPQSRPRSITRIRFLNHRSDRIMPSPQGLGNYATASPHRQVGKHADMFGYRVHAYESVRAMSSIKDWISIS